MRATPRLQVSLLTARRSSVIHSTSKFLRISSVSRPWDNRILSSVGAILENGSQGGENERIVQASREARLNCNTLLASPFAFLA